MQRLQQPWQESQAAKVMHFEHHVMMVLVFERTAFGFVAFAVQQGVGDSLRVPMHGPDSGVARVVFG